MSWAEVAAVALFRAPPIVGLLVAGALAYHGAGFWTWIWFLLLGGVMGQGSFATGKAAEKSS